MQMSRDGVSTKELTKAFGWGPHHVMEQQDVQEFTKFLCTALEKGTVVSFAHVHFFLATWSCSPKKRASLP